MAAPDYVPLGLADRPRVKKPLPVPQGWTATRPADLSGRQPVGNHRGRPGPDQGYAMVLADRFADRLTLTEGEHTDDVMAGGIAAGMRRASIFGRGPVIFDLEAAFTLFGFLGGAPGDLVEFRQRLFAGAAHHYWVQRAIADAAGEPALRLTGAKLRPRLNDWRSLMAAPTA
ncbi:MAG: hypothetical protein ACT4OS_04800 [Acidimicrobiales bacterium]